MTLDKKEVYIAPKSKLFFVKRLSFLEYFSGAGDIDQWDDGEDLGDTEDYID